MTSPDTPVYSKAQVSEALQVVTEVTLDRVLAALHEVSYGIVQPKKEGKKIKVKEVVDMSDVADVIEKLRKGEEP